MRMPHRVTVNQDGVVLPNGRLHNSGDVVVLTDEEYHRLDTSLLGAAPLPVTYTAAVGSPTTAVA